MYAGRNTLTFFLFGLVLALLVLGGDRLSSVARESTSDESDEQPQAPTEVDFQRVIKPLLSDRCFKCHGPDESRREAGLRLDNEEGMFAELGNGDAIVKPGDLDASELYWRITSDDPDMVMPPADSNLSLNKEEIEQINQWIESGAKWENHWSFEKLRTTPMPDSAGDQWSRNEIDLFISRGHQSNGLQPAKQASPERLIRRLSFDLTGLPPTMVEVDAFLADPSESAYEALIDDLLERPSYGERMASDWLDLARYSDSYGYQVDRDRFVWPWRDWVIKSFNDNMSYDEFVTWQIAGDLLPNATDEQILATTFSRLHPQKVEGGSVPEEFRTEYVADRTHTFATAFLGLTLECARCHDHKYDPISQKEYYQLFAYFNNIDEAGLYSYFTSSIPTPTMLVADDAKKRALDDLDQKVREQEESLQAIRDSCQTRYQQWLTKYSSSDEIIPFSPPLKRLEFEETLNGPNVTIDGIKGNAVELSGDDGIGVGVGNFPRAKPFSVDFWMRAPEPTERAVIFHRSRAWTDAASRGYELLSIEGRLRWSLIHFWPGNAISIETTESVKTGEWVHVAVTYDGSNRAEGLGIYIDGEPAEITIVRDHLTKNITGGGGDNITLGERFRDRGFKKGALDEFSVHDRELTQLEIHIRSSLEESFLFSEAGDTLKEEELDRLLFEFYLKNFDEAYQDALAELQASREERNKSYDSAQEIMVMREMDLRRQTYLLNRGAYDAPGDPVEPGTLEALPRQLESAPMNRLGLARWLTGPARGLTARVAVNHYWQLMFGDGLVRTPEDFGSQGSPPSHPDLLEWLAQDFVDHDWNVKRLLKQMAMSSTYRQDSVAEASVIEADPENVWLARSPRYRLSAEMLRDQALAVSGLLVEKIGGPPVKPYELTESFKPLSRDSGEGLYRRSVYTYWKRTGPAPVMMALDASKRDICVVKRERTATPLQSLVLLNDPQFIEASRVIAQQLIQLHGNDDDAIMSDVFRRLTGRLPDDYERTLLLEILAQQVEQYASHTDEAEKFLAIGDSTRDDSIPVERLAGWALLTSTLMNFDECTTKR